MLHLWPLLPHAAFAVLFAGIAPSPSPALRGDAIPLGARIISGCHALLSDGRSIAELRAAAGSQFDPRVVDALSRSEAVATAKP